MKWFKVGKSGWLNRLEQAQRAYGGDGSGDWRDNTMEFLHETEKYNFVSQGWDAMSIALYGTDKYGRGKNAIDFSNAAISAIPFVSVEGAAGKELYNFSAVASEHMANPARAVPISLLDATIKGSKGVADPRGSKALMYYSELWKNGEKYNLEVLHDKATNSIWHFKYSR